MPNWCENTLIIRADKKEDLKELKSLLNDTLEYDDYGRPYGLLGAIISIPKELEGTTAPKDKPNWYDWCCSNWGTKWDVDCESHIIEDDYMEFSFNSAWAPPVAWLEKVASLFPDLHFSLKYDEPGVGFMGCAKGSNGEVVDSCIEY